MNRVLIQFAHPALHRSRVNRELIEAVHDLEGVQINDLYEQYPDSFISTEREQKLLLEHDAIVFQHPFYWYSSPAILKEWQDIVLEYGFAYGDEGTRLQGKLWLSAITTGGAPEAYQSEGVNRFSIRELLRPFEQTAHLCGMSFLEPFLVQGTHQMTNGEIAACALKYRRTVEQLRDGVLMAQPLHAR